MMGCVDGSYSRFGIFTDIERNAPERGRLALDGIPRFNARARCPRSVKMRIARVGGRTWHVRVFPAIT